MFIKLIFLSTGIIVLSLLGLSLNMLLKKDGKFPVTSIGKNKEMRKRGITCVKHDEHICERMEAKVLIRNRQKEAKRVTQGARCKM
jgi:hypothetical protein